MQQTILHNGFAHIDPIGQNERALKLSRGDPTVQKHPIFAIVRLTPTDHELSILNCYRQILFRKTSHGKCDPVAVVRCLFDIERRITFVSGFGAAFKHPFQLFKPKHMWVRGKR